ncbi:glycosyltransferase [bacterium]|nr:glycosyltransferase [bacterium]
MRVVIVDTSRELRGGQRQVRLLSAGLAESGVDVLVVTRPGSPLAEELAVHRVPAASVSPRFEGDPIAAWRLSRVLKTHGAQVVNAQSSHDHTLAMMAVAIAHPRPVRIVTRRVDFAPRGGRLNRRKYLRGADHYIAISHAVAEILVAFGVPRENVRVIPSAIEHVLPPAGARAALLAELGLPDGVFLIGDVASLVDHKGHRYLLEAFALIASEMPDAHLVLAGDGELRDELEALAGRLGIRARTHFLGLRNDTPLLYGAFDLFAMTSHLEGLCTSILDAMSAKVPVVATRAGGIPEIVRDGDTGYLAENRNPAAIAQAIRDARADPGQARRRAEHAFRMVDEEFGVHRMVAQTARLYDELLKGSGET